MKRFTLGELGHMTGLARSSLLHYESIGLLAPAGRSPAGYRLYGESELERLRAIRRYREAGLALDEIQQLFSETASNSAAILQTRLGRIVDEIRSMQEQKRQLINLLMQPDFRRGHLESKDAWVEMLRNAGYSEQDMHRWHARFEAEDPDAHAQFLQSLGISPPEIDEIRRWCASAYVAHADGERAGQ